MILKISKMPSELFCAVHYVLEFLQHLEYFPAVTLDLTIIPIL